MKKFAILLFILMVSLWGCSQNEKAANEEQTTKSEETSVEAEEADATTENETEIAEDTEQVKMIKHLKELIENGSAFDAGSYVKGDIPKGVYAFIPFEGSGQYYSEEDEAGDIIDNENFDSFGYVFIQGRGNVKTDGVLVSTDELETLNVQGAKELYEVVNDKEDYLESGYYKVGTDINAGQHIIESNGEAYVAVMAGPIGNSEIVDNENFNGRYSVNTQNGQYLKISRGFISE